MKQYYTDGSAIPNPGAGGWAVIDAETKQPIALGKATDTTNIRMEAEALIAAYTLANNQPVEIITDSEFWRNVLTQWAPGWETKGWKKSTRGEIQNLDLVQKLYTLYRASPAVKLTWTRAHVGTDCNELADEWANRAREGATI
jgi:ribonuclease HI